jgi:hypothetical protein
MRVCFLASLGLMGLMAALPGLAGCSGGSSDPFGPAPDFASIEQRLEAPTGTLAPGREATVLAEFASRRASSADLDVSGTGGESAAATDPASDVRSQAIEILDAGLGAPSRVYCNDLQYGRAVGTCACAGGGSFSYDFSSAQQLRRGAPLDATLKVRFDACHSSYGSIEGREFVKLRSKGGLNRNDLSLVMSLDVTMTHAGRVQPVDFDFVYKGGSYVFSVEVDDGYVVVTSTGDGHDGRVAIRDRNTTWTCIVTAGKGSCSSTSGEARSIERVR